MDLVHLIVLVLLVALMFGAGLKTDRHDVVKVLKNGSLIARALLANVVLVPVYGVVLVQLFHLNAFVATGILLMAIAPGVPFVVQSGAGKDAGSLSLAETLAVLLPTIAVVTVPISAFIVMPLESQAPIHLGPTLVTLVLFQLLPMAIGAYVHERDQALADRLERPVQIVFLLAAVTLLILIGPSIGKAIGVIYGSNGIEAAIIMAVVSMATGWYLGGPERDFRHTLAVGTTLRNVGVALAVAKENYSDQGVEAAVICYLVVQFVIVQIFHTVMVQRRRRSATT